MTTFGLIHGAWHSAWFWGQLIDELRTRGHEAVAIDLPCEDSSVLFTGYAELVAQSLAEAGDDVVLVASSLGGITAPLIPPLRPVREIILVGALLAIPGKSFNQGFADGDSRLVDGAMNGARRDAENRSYWGDHDEAVRVLYHDVDPALVAECLPRLRPQSMAPYDEPCPLDAWPEVPVRSLVCREDRVVPPEWSRQVARERLGIDAVELPGGHAPMLSRPGELAEAILA